MTSTTQKILVGGLLAITVAGSAQADGLQDSGELTKLYLTGHVGFANSDISQTDMQQAFNQQGINATVQSVDDTQYGYGLGLGYDFTPQWSAELNYLDMGQVDVAFTSTQAINKLKEVHPESGNGVTASGVYRYAIDDQVHLRFRAGLFNWSADYKTITGPGNQTSMISDSGTALFWGLGFGYMVTKQFKLTTEIQRFEFDNEQRTYLRLGLEWHCFN